MLELEGMRGELLMFIAWDFVGLMFFWDILVWVLASVVF